MLVHLKRKTNSGMEQRMTTEMRTRIKKKNDNPYIIGRKGARVVSGEHRKYVCLHANIISFSVKIMYVCI